MCKSPILFKGYLNLKKEKEKSLGKDGRPHNRDVAIIIPEYGNAFRINDRVNNKFKLQKGE